MTCQRIRDFKTKFESVNLDSSQMEHLQMRLCLENHLPVQRFQQTLEFMRSKQSHHWAQMLQKYEECVSTKDFSGHELNPFFKYFQLQDLILSSNLDF